MDTRAIGKALIALAIALLIAYLLAGCLPTVEPSPTPAVAEMVTRPTATPDLPVVTVTGDVFVRDGQGVVKGYLLKNSTVYAMCAGEWCYIDNSVLRFYRGCSSDNPDNLGCLAKE